jgi:hypothetical protein
MSVSNDACLADELNACFSCKIVRLVPELFDDINKLFAGI